jgi:hypothetical protein
LNNGGTNSGHKSPGIPNNFLEFREFKEILNNYLQMAKPQNRNNNKDGNGQPNAWYNNNILLSFMLMVVAIACVTVYLVMVNSSKAVERENGRYRELMMMLRTEIRQLQKLAKNNENVSE